MSALPIRSEEHTSELQSHDNLVCRLLLEKKKKNKQAQSSATRTCSGLPRHAHRTRLHPPTVSSLPRPSLSRSYRNSSLFFFFFLNNPAPPYFSPLPPPASFPI